MTILHQWCRGWWARWAWWGCRRRPGRPAARGKRPGQLGEHDVPPACCPPAPRLAGVDEGSLVTEGAGAEALTGDPAGLLQVAQHGHGARRGQVPVGGEEAGFTGTWLVWPVDLRRSSAGLAQHGRHGIQHPPAPAAQLGAVRPRRPRGARSGSARAPGRRWVPGDVTAQALAPQRTLELLAQLPRAGRARLARRRSPGSLDVAERLLGLPGVRARAPGTHIRQRTGGTGDDARLVEDRLRAGHHRRASLRSPRRAPP